MAGSTNPRDTAHDWEEKWRAGLDNSISALSDQQQQTAIVLERILNRLDNLEKRPGEARRWFATANQGAATLIALISLCVSTLGAFVTIILQHVSFH